MVSSSASFFFAEIANAASTVSVCAAGPTTCDYVSIQDAVDNVDAGGTITLMGDVAVNSQVTINKSLTINGNSYVVSPSFIKTDNSNNATFGVIGTSNVSIYNLTINGSAGTNLHGINVYESSGIYLSGLTIKNTNRYAVVVNSSSVNIDSINTSGNGWGGINVDDVTQPADLVITGDNYQSETPALYVEGPGTTFTDSTNTGQYSQVLPGVYGPTAPVPTPACSTGAGGSFDGFAIGSVNGQGGWSSTGGFDQAVVANDDAYGYSGNGCKSLRISNAVTSGGFGNQTFSPSATNEAGETSATSGGMSGGTRQNHYEAEFSIGTTQSTQQPGLAMSVSPDRGDGSRMSYLSFTDGVAGLDVTFYDVQGNTNPANFVATPVASGLSRSTPHTVKFVIDFVDGPSNDVVNIYIDGALVHTGTTWENYYRYDSEAVAEPSTRTVDSLLFRMAGTAVPTNAGEGFLIDGNTVMTTTTNPDHQAPVAYAGYGPVNLYDTKTFNLDGSSDDSTATYQWSKTSGPGTATFVDSQAANTNVTVSAYGEYLFTLIATDPTGNVSDPSTIVVRFAEVSNGGSQSGGSGSAGTSTVGTTTPASSAARALAFNFFAPTASDQNTPSSTNASDSNGQVLGTSTDSNTNDTKKADDKSSDSTWTIFGMAWYWWIAILTVIVTLTYIVARRRNTQA